MTLTIQQQNDRRRTEIINQKIANCKGNKACLYRVAQFWRLDMDYNVGIDDGEHPEKPTHYEKVITNEIY